MKFTPAKIKEMEVENPVSDSLKALIFSSFKDEYERSMYLWTLMARPSRRKKLDSLLNGEQVLMKYSVPISKSTIDQQKIVRIGNMTINLDKLFERDMPKNMNKNHYDSALERDGLFCYAEKKATQSPSVKSTIGREYAKMLFKPSIASKLSSIADESVDFLKILIDWCERNPFPIDPMKEHPNLHPSKENRNVANTIKEDHIYTLKPKAQKDTSLIRTRNIEGPAFQVMSNYKECFNPDIAKSCKKSLPIKPIVNPKPFSTFPETKRPKNEIPLEQYREQSRINREMGRKNRSVFLSPTVL